MIRVRFKTGMTIDYESGESYENHDRYVDITDKDGNIIASVYGDFAIEFGDEEVRVHVPIKGPNIE